MDSCVGITVYSKQNSYSNFYGYGSNNSSDSSDDQQASGEGSGVIMKEANGKTYIMTCAHVIADGSSFKVTLNNGKEYTATMVGADSQTDIGVLSIEATGLQAATFADSKKPDRRRASGGNRLSRRSGIQKQRHQRLYFRFGSPGGKLHRLRQ